MIIYTKKVNFLLKKKIKKLFELTLKETKNIKDIEVGLNFVSEEEIGSS